MRARRNVDPSSAGRARHLRLRARALLQEAEASAAKPADPEQERRFWYQYYFQTERGRNGLLKMRGDIAKLLWRLWSPEWAFDDATFAKSAVSFDNPDFVEVTLHSYRHRASNAPSNGRYGRRVGSLIEPFAGALIARQQLKSQTPAAHRLDDTLRRTIITEGLARRVDAGCNRGVGDDASPPDVLDDFIVAHQATPMSDEKGDQLEDLRLDVYNGAVGKHGGRVEINLESVEYQETICAGVAHLDLVESDPPHSQGKQKKQKALRYQKKDYLKVA